MIVYTTDHFLCVYNIHYNNAMTGTTVLRTLGIYVVRFARHCLVKRIILCTTILL